MARLTCVGWWCGEDPALPDPRNLVDLEWEKSDRDAIVRYLRSGRRLTAYQGYSTCRFRCGVPEDQMGDADVTDGRWVWPEGLAHYVETHGVRLPDEFVADIRAYGFEIRCPSIEPNVAGNREEYPCDFTFWMKWSERNGMP
jgi:hypothetical protein